MRREPVPKYDRKFRLSHEEADLIRRRTLGFLTYGTHLPIEHLLAEAYLQGMRDALQCQEAA